MSTTKQMLGKLFEGEPSKRINQDSGPVPEVSVYAE